MFPYRTFSTGFTHLLSRTPPNAHMNKFLRFYVICKSYFTFDCAAQKRKIQDFTVITPSCAISSYHTASCPFQSSCSNAQFTLYVLPLIIPRSHCGMSCCVTGTGTGQDGRNQRTVIAVGRAGSGERSLAMLSVGTLQLST